MAERTRDASCPSVVIVNSTTRRAQSFRLLLVTSASDFAAAYN